MPNREKKGRTDFNKTDAKIEELIHFPSKKRQRFFFSFETRKMLKLNYLCEFRNDILAQQVVEGCVVVSRYIMGLCCKMMVIQI